MITDIYMQNIAFVCCDECARKCTSNDGTACKSIRRYVRIRNGKVDEDIRGVHSRKREEKGRNCSCVLESHGELHEQSGISRLDFGSSLYLSIPGTLSESERVK